MAHNLSAAAKGSREAQLTLAKIYWEGAEGITGDNEKAYFWYSVATKTGDKTAIDLQATVSQKLTAAQIKRIDEEVREWKPQKVDFTPRPLKPNSPETTAVDSFLSLRTPEEKDSHEGKKLFASIVADLDEDGSTEIVLIWTRVGPTYWDQNLTIFSSTSHKYAPATSLMLKGEVAQMNIVDGMIVIQLHEYRKTDPRCCPSIPMQRKYLWHDGKLSELP
jgi:hypothetical protein